MRVGVDGKIFGEVRYDYWMQEKKGKRNQKSQRKAKSRLVLRIEETKGLRDRESALLKANADRLRFRKCSQGDSSACQCGFKRAEKREGA